jgi:phosphoribosylglycinamide formyltransferase-1
VLVNAYEGRIINIHPADTQQHQGLNGYEWAFEQGLKTTKVTVHYVDEGLDTGSIIEQYAVDLSNATTLEEVERLGLAVEHANYSRAIKRVIEEN